MDDVFGESMPDESLHLERRFHSAGYREGITAGKLASLQAGFNDGYQTGVPLGKRLGEIRGRLTALIAIATMLRCPADNLRGLLSDANKLSFAELAPPDAEAEEHARLEHGEPFEISPELDPHSQVDLLAHAMNTLSSDDATPKSHLSAQQQLSRMETSLSAAQADLGI
ncbi:uncharacterized protein L969DRAFT_91223 [Mixia osmundae IAM 14324]|uniref:Protein YAE1 n=1 Tax=Mixia osmundae (strain CBS 9802 / IAM 14324 / JCM 22182 / KY 12970) TaxID=764103 RepID=G7DS06_MIXOS|nr:uncharacterized protein L969DRAFT_91223 [Mixia osmundae IAM 14324]KEI36149.1 hypothetical protein L969DRAFT_91223 [Mixia osmundae IAM 14324]GAA93366.1 hypothetical protein E5Q_00006 [Mixia osmundae IAM 14324]